MVADIDGNKIRDVVRKMCTERRKNNDGLYKVCDGSLDIQ